MIEACVKSPRHIRQTTQGQALIKLQCQVAHFYGQGGGWGRLAGSGTPLGGGGGGGLGGGAAGVGVVYV